MDFLPLFRFPWRKADKQTGASYLEFVISDVVGIDGFELDKSIAVKSWKLGIAKTTLQAICLAGYLFYYCLYRDKSYLAKAPVSGVVRLQLQHPVQSCDPLSSDCRSKFKDMEELPYCLGYSGQSSPSVPQEKCLYLDEYNLVKGSEAFGANSLMIPTRYSETAQRQECKLSENCDHAYKFVNTTTVFVADVESFTLLVDHAMHCDILDISGAACDYQGFVRPCGPPYNCELLPLDNHAHFAAFLDKRASVDDVIRNKTRAFWNAGPAIPQKDAFSLPNGDVLRVGFLADMLNIDLDASLNYEGHTHRKEGMVIMLHVVYQNYKKNSLPNTLPTIYEYRFSIPEIETFKTTSVAGSQHSVDRFITNWHGLFISSDQIGKMGRHDLKSIILMILETSFVFSIVRWFIRLVALNWFAGDPGDELEYAAQEEYELDDDVRQTVDGQVKERVFRRKPPRKQAESYQQLLHVQAEGPRSA